MINQICKCIHEIDDIMTAEDDIVSELQERDRVLEEQQEELKDSIAESIKQIGDPLQHHAVSINRYSFSKRPSE